MKQRVEPGGMLDMLTKSELQEAMGHHFDHAVRDLYRGVDYLMFQGQANNSTLFTIPNVPEAGYSWSVKLIGITSGGLSAGQFAVYLGENANTAPVGIGTGNGSVPNTAIATWSSEQLVIKDGRSLTIAAGAAITNYVLTVKQVPTEMQGKL